jgi:hypothetical protein
MIRSLFLNSHYRQYINGVGKLAASLHFFCSRPVSRVLYGSGFSTRIKNRFPSFVLSCHHWHDHTTYPPATDEQSLKPVYMVFQPIRRTAPGVATGTGELLPHLFTLVRRSFSEGEPCIILQPDGYFLLRYYTLADIFPLGRMALFVARTFLPDHKPGRWNSLLHRKDTNYHDIEKAGYNYYFYRR